MWKIFVDWCTVLGFALGLWLILAKPRAYIKRWILNWWAERSRVNTLIRIQQLEEISTKIGLLLILTPFEDMVLLGLSGICMFIAITPALAALVYLTTTIDPRPEATTTVRGLITAILLALVVVLNALIGFGIKETLEKFRQQRSQAYRDTISRDINNLKARLTARTPAV